MSISCNEIFYKIVISRDFAAIERNKYKIELIIQMKKLGRTAKEIAEFVGWDINEVLPFFESK